MRILDVRQGSQTLARVPVVPGLVAELQLPLPDGRQLLEIETALLEAQDGLIDLAARRQALAARIKLAKKAGQDEAAKLTRSCAHWPASKCRQNCSARPRKCSRRPILARSPSCSRSSTRSRNWPPTWPRSRRRPSWTSPNRRKRSRRKQSQQSPIRTRKSRFTPAGTSFAARTIRLPESAVAARGLRDPKQFDGGQPRFSGCPNSSGDCSMFVRSQVLAALLCGTRSVSRPARSRPKCGSRSAAAAGRSATPRPMVMDTAMGAMATATAGGPATTIRP